MALRDQPFLPLYIQDIMTDEKLNECSAATHGIYIKGIMCLMHKSEEYGKLLLKQKYKQTEDQNKNFASQLIKHLPYSEIEIEKALIELIKEKVCFYDNDYLCQKRMIRDNEISLLRAKAGKEGGLRTQSDKAKSKAKASANSEDEDDNEIEKEHPLQKEETSPESTINNNPKINRKRDGKITPELFDDFWELYPRKDVKGKAKTKWNLLCKNNKDCPTWIEVKKAIRDQIKTERWQTRKYIPLPATWINQYRWLDDPEQMTSFDNDVKQNKNELTDKENDEIDALARK